MLREKAAWGVIPQGFVRVIDEHGNRLLVRQDQAAHIDFSLCQDDQGLLTTDCHYRGRGALKVRQLPNRETVLIRSYRHGGLFRRLTGTWFFTWPPRPFRELAITEELRRRGLRTVEVYAACVSRPMGPFYRGWLITRRLRNAEDLWSALQSGLARQIGLPAALRAVADSIGAMHRQGVYHADLNLKNILLEIGDRGVGSYIIDYDKARLFLGKLPAAMAERNLARLRRSVRKLDPEEKFFPAAAWKDFMGFYDGARDT